MELKNLNKKVMVEIRKGPFLLQQQWCIWLITDFRVLSVLYLQGNLIKDVIFYFVFISERGTENNTANTNDSMW